MIEWLDYLKFYLYNLLLYMILKKIWYDKIFKIIFKLMICKKYVFNFFWNLFCCKNC